MESWTKSRMSAQSTSASMKNISSTNKTSLRRSKSAKKTGSIHLLSRRRWTKPDYSVLIHAWRKVKFNAWTTCNLSGTLQRSSYMQLSRTKWLRMEKHAVLIDRIIRWGPAEEEISLVGHNYYPTWELVEMNLRTSQAVLWNSEEVLDKEAHNRRRVKYCSWSVYYFWRLLSIMRRLLTIWVLCL